MPHSSMRTRLTLWYVAFFGILLGVSGTMVYQLLARNRVERLESRLELAVRSLASSLEHEIEEHAGVPLGESSFQRVLAGTHRITFPDLTVRISQGSRMVAEMHDPSGAAIPPQAWSDTKVLKAGERRNWSLSGRRYYAECVAFAGSSSPYHFVGSLSQSQTDQENAALRNAFVLGLPVPLLLAAVGGWWLARQSFNPVHQIIDAVERITPSALERRLPVPSSDRQLARLAQTFNSLLARLEQAFRQQRQFMADASHELRTPVSIAHAASQIALDVPNRPEQDYREALAIVDGQMQRMSRTVRDMFLLARADSGFAPLELTKFYLDELLAGSIRAARILAGAQGITLVCSASEEAPYCGDETLLQQAVMILLDNAIRFSSPGGTVTVSLIRQANSQWAITVKDAGPGVAVDQQERIFERFYRGDASRARAGDTHAGAGLGLPIARWIAQAHGGSLNLVSSGPDGSTFLLILGSAAARPSHAC